MIADARRLIEEGPGLSKWISATGVGNSPSAIKRLAQIARGQKGAGKLEPSPGTEPRTVWG